MVTWGQDMVALLLLEVTSTVNILCLRSLGADGKQRLRTGAGCGGGVERDKLVHALPCSASRRAVAAGLCNAGLAVNMGATFGNYTATSERAPNRDFSPGS